ncbi:spore cortex biosynthesis protein YabQ [Neobacillus niacini]|jgi:spore cortex biosynthesis protein YabQ|uniref:spore cortex biosynthesis protein YabQ n=1 Tax=Neobacillus niacini TaxID=86668 RepID=UPI00277F18D8|nr:spore cortex biosynthesis protein YabQ [Neobacillus niacini]MDQ0999939.1 spore cortex biosynthesis protein YabQ [Neobacillus niacini]
MTLSTQFLTMLSMIGMGSLFGVMFDTYQRFLDRPNRKSWIVFINDLLFWVIQALIIFYILFIVNNGELRFYIFVALLCGFAAYQSLFKGIYLKLLEFMIRSVISLYQFIRRAFQLLIYKPVVGIIQLLISVVIILGRGIYSLVKFILKVLLFILKVVWVPIVKILIILWKLLPKSIKKYVEKLYNKTAGIYMEIKNYLGKWLKKWKRPKK